VSGAVPRGAVVVGVDGSQQARAALAWAVEEAAWRAAPLRLVHVRPWSEPGVLGPQDARGRLLRTARTVLTTASEQARAAAALLGVEVVLQPRMWEGDVAEGLLSASHDALVVVLGSRGRGGAAGLLLGSVSAAVTAHGVCPVVVVRPEPRSGPVVVGVDGSPASESAIAFAFAEAEARDAPLLAVHAWRDGLVDPAWAHIYDWDVIEESESAVLAERLAGWGPRHPDVDLVRLVTRDTATHALVAQSSRAQLVVVGAHGRSALGRLLLGSVSRAVLHRAVCSVAVVHPRPPDERAVACERGPGRPGRPTSPAALPQGGERPADGHTGRGW
jgi:nucleotide-binding universal stress UspA family protein